MALFELAAAEAAYEVLQPLDAASRRRALQWLSDALADSKPLTRNGTRIGTAADSGQAVPAFKTRRRVQSADAGKRGGKSATTAGRSGRGRTKAGVKGDGAARSYRRMPDADDVMAAYGRVGTISGLAEHFEVPVYTVHSWARRLRDQGYQIGRQS